MKYLKATFGALAETRTFWFVLLVLFTYAIGLLFAQFNVFGFDLVIEIIKQSEFLTLFSPIMYFGYGLIMLSLILIGIGIGYLIFLFFSDLLTKIKYKLKI